ncbi:MAG: (S)-ureidoglycine aminohydrolase [Verrucomicrobiales bacterium]|nr:(S)-ureidoglycine aminohydrolase [Verrucomicrobiales bacterium]
MQPVFGETRTYVGARHALIAPDGHVPSRYPGFEAATPYYMISPAMGANLVQMAVVFEKGGKARFPVLKSKQRFFYIEEGAVEVTCGELRENTGPGNYLYSFGKEVRMESGSGCRMTVFESAHESSGTESAPEVIFGDAAKVKGEPFLGNERALLQTLLPDELAMDMAVNIFTYEPGATLPFVETHIMEHGLLMLSGQGIYRLEDKYYPVGKGDVIWMAPYCPQWFVAMGDEPASYLYYKNINRHCYSEH